VLTFAPIAVEYEPAAQSVQTEALLAAEYAPGRQEVQESEPLAVLNFPVSQGMHDDDDCSSYVPVRPLAHWQAVLLRNTVSVGQNAQIPSADALNLPGLHSSHEPLPLSSVPAAHDFVQASDEILPAGDDENSVGQAKQDSSVSLASTTEYFPAVHCLGS